MFVTQIKIRKFPTVFLFVIAPGGKTWSILVDNLRFVEDSNYFSVFFRNTITELETNLWPEALKMYRPFLEYQSGPLKGKWIGPARIKDKDHSIIFPSGAKSKFTYMQYDKDADSWYGSEISRAYFDEFQRKLMRLCWVTSKANSVNSGKPLTDQAEGNPERSLIIIRNV